MGPRFGLERLVDPPEPPVYVTDRWAYLPVVSIFGPLVLRDTIRVIKAAIRHLVDGQTWRRAYTAASPAAALRMPKPVRR